ncbi:hypothetical protein ACIOHE_13725 [Streptomyces sp. NPDC087851]|uniref:hypothetical protein n=1 Tax=Streptomyces sp. NPDC087851 TaxID=3365810 RepID=UPI003825922F
MPLFNRNKKEESAPANPEMAELGREYAIAKRHGDRKTTRRITRQIDKASASDRDSFEHGKTAYDSIPPVPTWRPTRRR